MKEDFSYQFTVELKNFKPHMWRRFQIASDLSLADLGYAIVAMFEASGAHLFHFYDRNEDTYYECDRYESPTNFGYGSNTYKSCYAKDVRIAKLFSEVGNTLEFEYDFGDSWLFKVKLEKIVPKVDGIKIIKGAGYGIVEDCGGIWGLSRAVELCQTRYGREYEEFVAWSGLVEFDVKNFDPIGMSAWIDEAVFLMKECYEGRLEP